MINPLALKVVLGGAIATGAGTAGVIYREEIKGFVEKQFSTSNASDLIQAETPPRSEGSDLMPEDKETVEDTTVNSGTQSNHSDDGNTAASVQTDQNTHSDVSPQVPIVVPIISAENTASSTYIIVKTTETSDSGISNPLYSTDGNTKNFNCVVNGSTGNDNDSCDIYLISEKSDGKLNNLSDIKTFNTKAKQNEITNNQLFKLTIKDSLLSNITWDGSQKVDIVSKDETKTTSEKKKYDSFTLQYKVTETDTNTSVVGKTNLIIGKIKTKNLNGDLNENPSFKCKLDDENTKESCSLFKITSSVSDDNIKDVSFSGLTNATQTATDYEVDKYFVIDLKRRSKKDVSDFTNKTITVEVSSDDTNKAVATFDFKAALSETTNDFATNNLSKIIFA